MLPLSVIVDPSDFSASPEYPFPIGRSRSRPVDRGSCTTTEPNHYAVVALDAAGLEFRGWDFKALDRAKAFAEHLRLKGLRVQVWARDEYGRRLLEVSPLAPRSSPRWRRCWYSASCRTDSVAHLGSRM